MNKENLVEKPSFNKERDPDFAEFIEKFVFDSTYSNINFSQKERELIIITALTAIQTLKQLENHIKAALKAGCSEKEIREAIYQGTPFIGIPKTINALNILNNLTNAMPALGKRQNKGNEDFSFFKTCFKEDNFSYNFNQSNLRIINFFFKRGVLGEDTRTLLLYTTFIANSGNYTELNLIIKNLNLTPINNNKLNHLFILLDPYLGYINIKKELNNFLNLK